MRCRSIAFLLLFASSAFAEKPIIFWGPDQVAPGDTVLLYGGGLATANKVHIREIISDTIKVRETSVDALQPNENSLKFIIPATMHPAIFEVRVETPEGLSPPRLLNVPEVWFAQPTKLQPGLKVNQLPPGSEFQIVGKNLVLQGDASNKVRIGLAPEKGGPAIDFTVSKAEIFSLQASLPKDLPPGRYDLMVNNGYGGKEGWKNGFIVEIKAPESWPNKSFNVRDFGAKGDDVTDDTKAIREALAAADQNGGGVVYFPWGTYRLSDWIVVPERTVLKGEVRDATLLKWPLDPPTSEKDFSKAAVYLGAKCGLENLTLVARKVENILYDVQAEFNNPKSVPVEATSRIRPWGRGGDIFLRKVTCHHLLLAGRPENQKPVLENPALNKRYWEGLRNLFIHEGKNLEVSDCVFQGGDNQFGNLENGRVVRNLFANSMGYSWTALGGGAHDVVCEGNEIRASSSWGWGWIGLQRVYSAHNTTYNFVRGEREAMTVDNSALASSRPPAEYWGAPVEVGGTKEKPFLRFPPATETSTDGFKTGWTPGCFKGGNVFIRAFAGGPGGGQMRNIVDNTADTIFLDKPFAPVPETMPRKLYLEIAPRHHRAHNGTTAWIGTLKTSEAQEFIAKDANWIPDEFVSMTVLVMDGKGAGQFRVVAGNSTDRAKLDKPWDVIPDESSVLGIWGMLRQMIVYDTKGYDTSAFAQMYGPFYDYTVDSCMVERTQGIWGQCGWFTQFRNNTVSYFNSYHPGIGMRGPNPEKNAPFGYNGLDSPRIRITKAQSFQYPERKMPLFIDEVLGKPVPSTLAHIQKNNVYRYGQRMVVQPWSGDTPPGPKPGGALFRDIVFDANKIENSAVGIQIGPNVGGAILSLNKFQGVDKPTWLAKPENVLTVPVAKK